MLLLTLLGQPALLQGGPGGRPVRLTIRKTWCLLLLLACQGSAPRARLAATLWPSLDEATARRNLRRELARLREAGVPDLLHLADDRIALHPAVAVDLQAFEAALHRGDSAAALALWRGEFADGLAPGVDPAFDGWLDAERSRVHGLWRRALQAEAERAPPAQALHHWQALLVDDPLQEQHHQAVVALHLAAGRREEALAQVQRCRTLLRDELGLALSAHTEALAARARDNTARAAAAEPAAAPAPAAWLPDPLPFVGRDAEVAALEAAWQRGHTIVIEGEGGVGKTRLALDFVAAHGACALARCRSSDSGVPYASWTRVLRALAGTTLTREGLAALPPWACDELARLVPELAGSGGVPSPMRSDEERSRFFEACAAGWQALAAGSFDAVLLDDWHLADAASSAVMAYVVQRGAAAAGGGGPRVVVLQRPGAGETGAAATLAWRDAGSLLRITLQPLPPQQVFQLVQRLSGAREPARFAARLQAATEGNPFFLAQTLRHLADTGALSVDAQGRWRTPFDDDTHDYRELPMPATVREAVLARVERLGSADGRVLEAAALAAEPFSPALLAPACALSEIEAVLAIERAVQAGLLREHGRGGYAFVHDLVQQALDGALGPERRRLIHRRLALGAEAAQAPPAVIAAHHEASGQAQRAVPHRLAAAEQAQHLHALPEAMQHWRQALADGATPRQALRAHEGLMLGARMGCDFEAMLAEGDALQQLAAEGSGLGAEERAAALVAVADNLAFGNRAEAALALLDRIPATSVPTPPSQARQATIRSHALHALGRLEEARTVCTAALGLPGLAVADRSNLLDALSAVEFSAGRTAAVREQVQRLLQLAQASGSHETAARARLRGGITWLIDGEHDRAQADLEQAAQSFARCGSVYRQRMALYNLALVHQAQSRHEQALQVAQQGWQLQPSLPEGDLRLMFRLAFVDSQVALGRWGPAWEHAQAALAYVLAQSEPQPLCAACLPTLELLGLLGEVGLARQALGRLTPAMLQELQYMASEHWISVAQFELSLGDAAAAARALALAPPAGQIADVRVRARHALAAAELRLAEGDAGGALALLPPPELEGMNDEMRTRALALALRAQGAGGAWGAQTVSAALQALAGPAAFAPATLQLHRALAQAVQQGLQGVPPDRAQARGAFVALLAQSLCEHPAQQAAFLHSAR
jgi:DNA-binding SARP family transcriptional activator/tetratricopeptide (TPR) repeat protein